MKTPYGRKAVWAVHYAIDSIHTLESPLYPGKMRWAKELGNTKEAFLCWMLPLLHELLWADDLEKPITFSNTTMDQEMVQTFKTMPIQFPDYVMDMHVTGISDPVRFAVEGSHVENENVDRIVPLWKKVYNASKHRKRPRSESSLLSSSSTSLTPEKIQAIEKRIQTEQKELGGSVDFPNILTLNGLCPVEWNTEQVPLETDTFQLVTRIQLTTSRNKTDVYFATRGSNKTKLWVVKGPLARITDAEQSYYLSQWKRQNDVPCVDMEVLYMIPDRWPKGVPLGVRNQLDCSKPAIFLISPCILPITPTNVPVKTHSSKVWPPTQVVDWSGLSTWLPMKFASSEMEQQTYVLALCYRFVFGLGDLANRNFVRAQGQVISVDEDGVPKHLNFLTELKKNKLKKVQEWCTTHWDMLLPKLKHWCLNGPYAKRRNQILKLGPKLFDVSDLN